MARNLSGTHLRPIVPTVLAQTCFMCRAPRPNLCKIGDKSPDGQKFAQDLKKYLNIEAATGSICDFCQKTVSKIGTKVEELRGNIVESDPQVSKLKRVRLFNFIQRLVLLVFILLFYFSSVTMF